MQGGCNFPMGPLALLDLVGLDTSLSILEALYAEFKDPNYAPAPLLRRMVERRALRPEERSGFLRVPQEVASLPCPAPPGSRVVTGLPGAGTMVP